jgi:alkanesulfonate monooxygenase SsuD/methylene tetrahydromethanopterin reductase-like flavin-dependent oxidoreductase (luciferase family)
MEFHLFLPQLRLSFERLVASARAAEAAGFRGIAGMDHLVPPGAEGQPMYEATVVSTWLAAHTERLAVGSLVLCDAFRHPAVLAREALWAGETVDYHGEFHHLSGAAQAPGPLGRIPVVIGGAGPRTMALVSEFADWWNVQVTQLHKLEQARSQAGSARVSVQQMVAYVPDEASRAAVTETATRRFGAMEPVIGTGPELADHFGRLGDRGVQRVYTWFCDFAPPETLAPFGAEVIRPLVAEAV